MMRSVIERQHDLAHTARALRSSGSKDS
jgi:hypothetical protein